MVASSAATIGSTVGAAGAPREQEVSNIVVITVMSNIFLITLSFVIFKYYTTKKIKIIKYKSSKISNYSPKLWIFVRLVTKIVFKALPRRIQKQRLRASGVLALKNLFQTTRR
jgi:hypothetical protein